MRLQGAPARGRQLALVVVIALIVAVVAAYLYLTYIV